jgi:aryl-alcohol dehydrogenase-like predicted oxidoreductase
MVQLFLPRKPATTGLQIRNRSKSGIDQLNNYVVQETCPFKRLDVIRTATSKYQLTESECALRWIMNHSQLRAEHGDAVIIGASNTAHMEENLKDFEKGPLPEEVAQGLDRAWAMSKGVAWNYYH